MVDGNKVLKGSKIAKMFPGGQFEETQIIRKSIELLMSTIDETSLTEEEKVIYDKFYEYNNKVEDNK